MTSDNTLTLSMIPFVPWAVYLVADKKGFWKRNGFSVDLVIHPCEEDYVASMAARSSDMYPLPLSSVLELAAGGHRFLSTGFFDLADGHKNIIVKKEFHDRLKGQTILCYSDEISNRYCLSRFLSTHALTLFDVNLEFCESTRLVSRFAASDVAACLVFEEPVDTILTQSVCDIVYSTASYTEPFTIAVPAERYQPALVQHLPALIGGRSAAVSWIMDPANKSEFSDLVARYLFNGRVAPGPDRIMLLYRQLRTPGKEALLDLNTIRAEDVFKQLTQTCQENGMISEECARNFTREHILKNQALIQTLKEGGHP